LSEPILFVSAPERKKRSPAFAGSIFLHGAFAGLMALKPLTATVSEPTPARMTRKYSVVLLRFQPPPSPKPVTVATREHDLPMPTPEPNVPRRFELPATVHVRPVKQTLVQLDVPPDVVLKQEIPLPTALLWTQTAKPLLLPPLDATVRVAADQQAPPKLEPPNAEPTVADLKIANALLSELPQLPVPAATTSPVRTADSQKANHIPETSPAFIGQTTVPVNLISDPEHPVSSTTMVVVLPANQVVPSSGAGQLELRASVGGEQTASEPHASASESEPRASTSGSEDDILPGTTRIDLPKDGKFGAVVLASATSSPYPESETALSSKLVRTVYLQMGLRKSWILQYCQLDNAVRNTAVQPMTTPIEAPWPFLMFRPDELSTSDYIVVHGTVTADGRFDQLALVFPEDLAQKDLLMGSLKRWQFRPASQAGQNTAVEALLIIPREAE
jgi:hypothetical protein